LDCTNFVWVRFQTLCRYYVTQIFHLRFHKVTLTRFQAHVCLSEAFEYLFQVFLMVVKVAEKNDQVINVY